MPALELLPRCGNVIDLEERERTTGVRTEEVEVTMAWPEDLHSVVLDGRELDSMRLLEFDLQPQLVS